MTTPVDSTFTLPVRIKLAMFFRLLALQGSWNYETLNGTGLGFAMERCNARIAQTNAG